MAREITDIGWEPGNRAVHITWVDEADIRMDGGVAVRHTIRIDGVHPRYAEAIDRIRVAAEIAVRDAIKDWSTSEPARLDDAAHQRALDEDELDEELDSERRWEAIRASQETGNREAPAVRPGDAAEAGSSL